MNPDPTDTNLLQLVHPLAKDPPQGLFICRNQRTLPLTHNWSFLFELGKSKRVVELTKLKVVLYGCVVPSAVSSRVFVKLNNQNSLLHVTT